MALFFIIIFFIDRKTILSFPFNICRKSFKNFSRAIIGDVTADNVWEILARIAEEILLGIPEGIAAVIIGCILRGINLEKTLKNSPKES